MIAILTVMTTSLAKDNILESYVQEAIENNPSLHAALARIRAFDQRIPQAGALPDPTIGIGVANLPTGSFAFDQEPMTGKWISLGQTFLYPGIRGLRRKIAESQRDHVAGRADAIRLNVIQQVKETYFRWADLRQSIRIVDQNQLLLDQFTDVATAAYRVGRGAQQDVLRARTEWTRFEDRLLALRQAEASAKARLNTLLNRPLDSPLQDPRPLEPTSSEFTRDSLSTWMKTSNPELRSLNARIDAAKHDERLAKRLNFPKFALGAKYSQRDDSPGGMKRDDFFSFQIQTSIPLYKRSKQNRQIQQKQLEVSQVQSEYESLLNELSFRLEDQSTRHEALFAQVEVYQNAILPQARQTLDAALADYQVGRVDFLTLLTSQTAVYNYELALLTRLREYQTNLSRLEVVVGRDLAAN